MWLYNTINTFLKLIHFYYPNLWIKQPYLISHNEQKYSGEVGVRSRNLQFDQFPLKCSPSVSIQLETCPKTATIMIIHSPCILY